MLYDRVYFYVPSRKQWGKVKIARLSSKKATRDSAVAMRDRVAEGGFYAVIGASAIGAPVGPPAGRVPAPGATPERQYELAQQDAWEAHCGTHWGAA